jgi:hypothetical protein
LLKMRLGKVSVHQVSLRGALATKQSRRLMLRLLRFARNDLEFEFAFLFLTWEVRHEIYY